MTGNGSRDPTDDGPGPAARPAAGPTDTAASRGAALVAPEGEPEGRPRGRGSLRGALGFAVGAAAVYVAHLALDYARVDAPAWFRVALGVAFVVCIFGIPIVVVLRPQRAERRLGRRYTVYVGDDAFGFGEGRTLEIDDRALCFGPLAHGMDLRDPAPLRVPLADVHVVRGRGSAVVLECERGDAGGTKCPPAREVRDAGGAKCPPAREVQGGRRWTLPIRPMSYADRQHLLWELAVRIPDAVERGIRPPAADPPATPRR